MLAVLLGAAGIVLVGTELARPDGGALAAAPSPEPSNPGSSEPASRRDVTSTPQALPTSAPDAQPAPEARPTPAVAPSPDQSADPDPLADVEAADPVRIRIPSIDVDAPVDPLGLHPDGTIEVPEDFARTGWRAGGPEPGEAGAAVVLGHVDSRDGPAVFFRLRELEPGAQIHVDRADGSTATFEVARSEQHPKDEFPTQAVYGSTPDSTLRLVTCGGEFDRTERSYRDNFVVFAARTA